MKPHTHFSMRFFRALVRYYNYKRIFCVNSIEPIEKQVWFGIQLDKKHFEDKRRFGMTYKVLKHIFRCKHCPIVVLRWDLLCPVNIEWPHSLEHSNYLFKTFSQIFLSSDICNPDLTWGWAVCAAVLGFVCLLTVARLQYWGLGHRYGKRCKNRE